MLLENERTVEISLRGFIGACVICASLGFYFGAMIILMVHERMVWAFPLVGN